MHKQLVIILFAFIFLCSCENDKRRNSINTANNDSVRVENVTIKMNPSGGVFTIPCVVNGQK